MNLQQYLDDSDFSTFCLKKVRNSKPIDVRTVEKEQNQVAPIVAFLELQWKESSEISSHGNYHYTIWVVAQETHISRYHEPISCWHNLSVLHRRRRPKCASGRWGNCSEPGYT